MRTPDEKSKEYRIRGPECGERTERSRQDTKQAGNEDGREDDRAVLDVRAPTLKDAHHGTAFRWLSFTAACHWRGGASMGCEWLESSSKRLRPHFREPCSPPSGKFGITDAMRGYENCPLTVSSCRSAVGCLMFRWGILDVVVILSPIITMFGSHGDNRAFDRHGQAVAARALSRSGSCARLLPSCNGVLVRYFRRFRGWPWPAR